MFAIEEGRKPDYRLSGGPGQSVGLDNDTIEDRVEHEWYVPTIPRKRMKQLMRRNDLEGWKNFGPWLVLLIASGYFLHLTWGTWWALLALFFYGTIYSSSDARWHECGHGTPFRTRWINEAFYQLCSFMTLREAYLWRWSHARHHTHTIIKGRDPEIQVMRPSDLGKIVADFFFIFGGWGELMKIFAHALGIMTADAKEFVPESERPKMIRSSRIYVGIMGGAVVWAVAAGSLLPLLFVVTPRFYGGWHHQLCSLTQHAGLAEDVHDHRLNTRTVYMNPVYRFLYLNMNYHIEHHMYPMVPFWQLPALHEEVKHEMPRPYTGIVDAYREIIPALIRQARDPGYYVKRELPATARAAA